MEAAMKIDGKHIDPYAAALRRLADAVEDQRNTTIEQLAKIAKECGLIVNIYFTSDPPDRR